MIKKKRKNPLILDLHRNVPLILQTAACPALPRHLLFSEGWGKNEIIYDINSPSSRKLEKMWWHFRCSDSYPSCKTIRDRCQIHSAAAQWVEKMCLQGRYGPVVPAADAPAPRRTPTSASWGHSLGSHEETRGSEMD